VSAKALLRALAALGLLVVLWGAFGVYRAWLGDDPVAGLPLPAFSPAEVDGIEITAPAETLRFARTGADWTVNGHAADAEQVRNLMALLADSAIASELVARNPASHARLGVDTAGRRLVFRKGGDTLLDLVVGSSGTGFLGVYARVAGAAEVYQVRGALGAHVGRDEASWRDRRIAAVPADGVDRISIRHGRGETVLTRSGNAWMVGDAPADTAAVRRLLGALADIRAVGFASPEETDSLDFGRPDRRLVVLGPAADTLLDLLVDSTGAGFRVRAGARPDVFQLDFWRVNELIPPAEALRGKVP
jgi:hypothetical protein